ncbi:MAG: GHMP kinase [Verrucomicrobia bacterium]|nr:GHMP kinase [Verrucomicrobiota bacterium]
MKRIVNSVAPIRICDLGGWTDTWFAEHGNILNISIYPYVQCQMVVQPAAARTGTLTIHAENYGDRYTIDPSAIVYDRHPLLEAAVDAMQVPRDLDIEVSLYSEAPGGCSTGTSAAVSVALIGALDTLTPGHMTPGEVAARAHDVETRYLKLQCGIQDQIASAYGGICYIEMTRYPDARVSQLSLPNPIWWELEQRLSLIFLGNTHKSSDVHTRVIRELEGAGPDCDKINRLRQPPIDGKNALFAGDFESFGRAMVRNTDLQRDLNPSLVSDKAQAIIAVAKTHGAVGWKVNGAGGDGGSVTILSGSSPSRKREMVRQIEAIDDRVRAIPLYLSRYGLRVWNS